MYPHYKYSLRLGIPTTNTHSGSLSPLKNTPPGSAFPLKTPPQALYPASEDPQVPIPTNAESCHVPATMQVRIKTEQTHKLKFNSNQTVQLNSM